VENIGNDVGNDVTLTVSGGRRGGDYLLTVVGAVAGTRSYSISVNGQPAVSVPLTGSGFSSPLLGRSLQVRLRPRGNTVRIFNDTGYTPDVDKITLSPLGR
jgi:hypothetical protein